MDTHAAPAEHFRRYVYAAVLRATEQAAQAFGSFDALFEQFPFLAGYQDELATRGLEGCPLEEAAARWQAELREWEQAQSGHLPLRALRAAIGLDHAALTMFAFIGLIEEDARFGLLFDAFQTAAGGHRPTLGLVSAWWRDAPRQEARPALRALLRTGLVRVANPDGPRTEWGLHVPGVLWDAARGETTLSEGNGGPALCYRPRDTLLELDALIAPAPLRRHLARVPALLAGGEASAAVVRGPERNGRRTVLGTVARALGRGVLSADALRPDDNRWPLLGPLATMLEAMPVLAFDLAPGESAEAPDLAGYAGPLGIVMPRHGGLRGASAERAVMIDLDLPDVEARRRHWRAALAAHRPDSADLVGAAAERFRMTGGNIRRAAHLAMANAALDGRERIALADVRLACRMLHRQALEALAAFVPPLHEPHDGDDAAGRAAGWDRLAVCDHVLTELRLLESRCLHRERLSHVPALASSASQNAGVRALFSGPSGTGKTLAARALAAALGKDLYRLDLSAVVNKYIGETEKNLSHIFAAAETLDVVLLLDEGDALMTQRTSVQSSNDRYANLETNYLLQRLESYDGIVVVTTNAGERIDSAFLRRMDVLIEFRPPEPLERLAIWRLHLPQAHAIAHAMLEDVAYRCVMTGGQIRNAAVHAALLALDDGRVVNTQHLEAAVLREYRKAGALCPLRRTTGNGHVKGAGAH